MSRIGTPTVLGTYTKNQFTGDGLERNFQLSAKPGSPNAIDVYVGNVYQHSSYTISEDWLIFDDPIPDEEVVHVKILGRELQINHPADGSVDEVAINTGRNTQIREALELVKQSSPTDTTPGSLPVLHDIGGSVGQISLESLPVATQEQTDEPEGVDALIRADRQWAAPGWKHIETYSIPNGVNAFDFPVSTDYSFLRISMHTVNADNDWDFGLRVSQGNGFLSGSGDYARQGIRVIDGNISIDDIITDHILLVAGLTSNLGGSAIAEIIVNRERGNLFWSAGGTRSGGNYTMRSGYVRIVPSGEITDFRLYTRGSQQFSSGIIIVEGYRQ